MGTLILKSRKIQGVEGAIEESFPLCNWSNHNQNLSPSLRLSVGVSSVTFLERTECEYSFLPSSQRGVYVYNVLLRKRKNKNISESLHFIGRVPKYDQHRPVRVSVRTLGPSQWSGETRTKE